MGVSFAGARHVSLSRYPGILSFRFPAGGEQEAQTIATSLPTSFSAEESVRTRPECCSRPPLTVVLFVHLSGDDSIITISTPESPGDLLTIPPSERSRLHAHVHCPCVGNADVFFGSGGSRHAVAAALSQPIMEPRSWRSGDEKPVCGSHVSNK